MANRDQEDWKPVSEIEAVHWDRAKDGLAPDSEVARVVTWMCRRDKFLLPPELASQTLGRLDAREKPRDVGEWLLSTISPSAPAHGLLSHLLADPPTRQDVLRRLDEEEREHGSSRELRRMRKTLLELPDDAFPKNRP